MTVKHKDERKHANVLSNVVAGDRVRSLDGGKPFVVAGVRRNPVTGHVRLFDENSVLRVEGDPESSVEVER